MLTGVHSIDIETYEQMLDMICVKGGNLLAIGQAGIGKTEIPFQRAIKHGLRTVYWNLATQEAPDLVGLPIIKMADGVEVVRYASPEYMPVAERNPDPVLVIVDELDKCKSELQNPLLEIYHSVQRGEGGTLNGRKLNIRGIVSTGNLPDEGAFSKPISQALTNRCMTFKLESNFEAWQAWAVRSHVNPLVVAFLMRHQDYLSMKPVIGDPTAYTRGSPRAWTESARDLDKLLALKAEGGISFSTNKQEIAFQTITIAGRVGEGPATQFRVWLEYFKRIEPKVDALVANGTLPSEAEISDMELGEAVVFCVASTQAIVDAAKKSKEPEAQKKEVHRVANNVAKLLKLVPAEHQIAAIKSVLESDFVKAMDLTKCPDLMKVYMSVRKVTKD
jgi:hypothetical protein